MFTKILAADRGEIAIRSLRSDPAEPADSEQADPGSHGRIEAPFRGTVTMVVGTGDRVARGDTLATIEAMKMEASITAPTDGVVSRVAIGEVQAVTGGDLVVVLES